MLENIASLLSENTILTIFIVILLGTIFGAIKFGPVKFGAAGALFIGLAFGAFVTPSDDHLTLLQNLGLGLFVYLIGLEAGEEFFKNIRSQFGLMLASVVAVTIAAVVAVVAGGLLGVAREVSVGAFAGALTSTPSLSLAQEQTGSALPAVGYSIGYPTGIVVAILLVAATINRKWKAKRDQNDADAQTLRTVRVQVNREVTGEELNEKFYDQFVIASVNRAGTATSVGADYTLKVGDEVHLVASKAVLNDLVAAIGRKLPRSPFRTPQLTVQRYSVSNQDIAGNQIGNLPLYTNNQAQIVRIRRGDEMLLATAETYLASGDIVEVVHPASKRHTMEAYFGNSIQVASELNWIATAGGLAIGYLFAIIPIPLPGGTTFTIGAAGGPLIAGLILGALQRTGGVAWQLPRSANYSIRQLGLMIFLAAVGIASGPAFVSTAFSLDGLITVLLAALIALAGCGSMLALAYFLGQSETRANGAVGGLLGQPAVLQYALQNSNDARIMSGYSTTFAIALIYKIVVVPFMVVV